MKTIVLLLALLAPLAAQNGAGFGGVWNADLAKRVSGGPAPEAVRCRIEQNGENFTIALRVTARGSTDEQIHRLTIGRDTQNQMHGAPMTSHAEWDNGTLVARSVAVFGGKELRMNDRWTLSPDGKTLTWRERHQFGSEPEGEDVHVFDRDPSSTWGTLPPPKLAEEVYKNIQIMKGMPAPRLQGVMTNLTRWLGVECAHCHVPGQFEKDDKLPKQTARKMFQMVRAIGTDYFPGSNPVTCWTCHRGQAKPQSLPAQ